jgi:hypothetical protein
MVFLVKKRNVEQNIFTFYDVSWSLSSFSVESSNSSLMLKKAWRWFGKITKALPLEHPGMSEK